MNHLSFPILIISSFLATSIYTLRKFLLNHFTIEENMFIDVLLYPIGMIIFLYFMLDMNKLKKKWNNGTIKKFIPYFLLATVLIVISIYLGFWLVANHDMSWIKPIRSGLVIILISLAGFFLYNETFSMKKILGTLLIVCGIVTMNS
tara:strand:- start:13731 stop:14171 length:441 start_codon:yes stop_codon:yes gene_type:complete